jgi:hypothetical protein
MPLIGGLSQARFRFTSEKDQRGAEKSGAVFFIPHSHAVLKARSYSGEQFLFSRFLISFIHIRAVSSEKRTITH